jgi:C_GCAxxG_C_C family probable redox protein
MQKSKKEILETAFNAAKQYEKKSGGCPQCTMAGIFEALDIDNPDVFKAATGFADGVGLTGDGHCGALSGGVMAISHIFGRNKEEFGDMTKLVKANLLAKDLHDRFIDKFGTCRCYDLQNSFFGRFYNLWDPAELKEAIQAGMLEQCSNVVGEVARMATEIILTQKERERTDKV